MPITQQGVLNTTALSRPDVYVQIVSPQVQQLNGVPTNIIGGVGSAPWGPVNSPVPISTPADYQTRFGAVQARKYDLGTLMFACSLQGANNFRFVRVTDGTDVAAAVLMQHGVGSLTSGGAAHVVGDQLTLSNGAIIQVATVSSGAVLTSTLVREPTTAASGSVTQVSSTGVGTGYTSTWTYTTGATITSKYTGTGANADAVIVAAGSQASTYKFTIFRPGQVPEVFDNIGGTGNALWLALVAAINNGQSGVRGPSQLVVATAGAGTGTPLAGTYTLAGGLDGAANVTATMLVGADGLSRTGMYALRGTKASIMVLADSDTPATWPAQLAFANAVGAYAILAGPAGETPSQAATAKATAGVDSYSAKVLLGDWVYVLDNYNGGIVRLISPQGFAAGRLAQLGPHESGLSKVIYGIVGTQKSNQNQVYSDADITVLRNAGIDVIANPMPGGDYFGLTFGHNSASNPVVMGDNYTRMTNYLAATVLAGLGGFIGRLQSADVRRQAKAVQESFLDGLFQQDMIGNAQGTIPYLVVLDDTNNPAARVAAGYMQMDVQVQYLSVIEFFIVNIQGGQTVEISRSSTQLAA